MGDDKTKEQAQQEAAAQADLEVSDEDAEQVEGGSVRVKFGSDRDPQGHSAKF